MNLTGKISALSISHNYIKNAVPVGGFCIDATAGRGYDTALFAQLVGETGRVISMDIQEAAISSTKALLKEKKLSDIVAVVKDTHENLNLYAKPKSVDCIAFNFGWLPGGEHCVLTKPHSSVTAVKKGLDLLKPYGIMSLCIYYGRDNGLEERDALLHFFKELDHSRFTVIEHHFSNRPNNPPLFVVIIKQG